MAIIVEAAPIWLTSKPEDSKIKFLLKSLSLVIVSMFIVLFLGLITYNEKDNDMLTAGL